MTGLPLARRTLVLAITVSALACRLPAMDLPSP